MIEKGSNLECFIPVSLTTIIETALPNSMLEHAAVVTIHLVPLHSC